MDVDKLLTSLDGMIRNGVQLQIALQPLRMQNPARLEAIYADYENMLVDALRSASEQAAPMPSRQDVFAGHWPEWLLIDSAPKTQPLPDGRVAATYLLGYCPDVDACDLESCVCVIWWEPYMSNGAGQWHGEGGYELHPTHWMPLPPPASARDGESA